MAIKSFLRKLIKESIINNVKALRGVKGFVKTVTRLIYKIVTMGRNVYKYYPKFCNVKYERLTSLKKTHCCDNINQMIETVVDFYSVGMKNNTRTHKS